MNIAARPKPSFFDLRQAVEGAEWNFWEAETDYLTHAIHRYSGKFIPQIAAQAISMLTREGDVVLDPYCGSGTTLLEAALLKRAAIGSDLNPLAALIARVKTTPIPTKQLDGLKQLLAEIVAGLDGDLFGELIDTTVDVRLVDPWYTKWFSTQNLFDLVRIHRAISKIEEGALKDVATVAFSDVLRRSSNAHQGYPNVMFDRRGIFRPRPGRQFLKALNSICESIASLQDYATELSSVSVGVADAGDLNIADESVDAVITHPPYVGSIPYAEYLALSLKWLGEDPKDLDKKLTGGQRQSRTVLPRFEQGYRKMLEESFRVLKRGGNMFLMVGNPTIKGVLVDLAEMTTSYCYEIGFEFVANTTRSAKNRRSNQMGDEVLLFFSKC